MGHGPWGVDDADAGDALGVVVVEGLLVWVAVDGGVLSRSRPLVYALCRPTSVERAAYLGGSADEREIVGRGERAQGQALGVEDGRDLLEEGPRG